MRKEILVILSALLLVGLVAAQPGSMPDSPDQPQQMQDDSKTGDEGMQESDYVKGEIIVNMGSASKQDARDVIESHNLSWKELKTNSSLGTWGTVEVPEGRETEFVSLLENESMVEYAEKNKIAQATAGTGTGMADQKKPSRAGPGMDDRRGPPKNVSQHLAQIQERIKNKTNKTVPGLTRAQEAVQTGQRMRSAVHGLIEASNLSGGIGQQVSQIARQINESVNETVEAENEVRRGGIGQFLFGGDHRAAERLNQTAQENLERVQQLRNTLDECDNCSQEVKSFMQEQVQNIQQEQDQLQELAQNEKRSKGLFGWIWK